MSLAPSDALIVALASPLPADVTLGQGLALHVAGRCRHPRRRIVELELGLAGHWEPVRLAAVRGEGFFASLVPPAPRAGRQALRMRARLDDGTWAQADLGRVQVRLASPFKAPGAAPAGRGPALAICMTTHQPDWKLLDRQLASIRSQTFKDWVCLIQDDASSPGAWARLRRVCSRDRRFRLRRNPRNLGFYRNFEACLRRVPASSRWVALSDQDDHWYPEKLDTLLRALQAAPGAQLAYSDMRIVAANGRVLHPSYYAFRRNSHRHLGDLLVANTVPGAASLFRRRLLERALPFPSEQGHSFHDHWIACAALTAGELLFVDAPLYDYVQHARNIIGHQPSEAQRPPWRQDLGLLRDLLLPSRWPRNLEWAEEWMMQAQLRTATLARTLRTRFPEASASKRAMLDLAAEVDRSLAAAFKQLVGTRRRGLDDLGMARAALRCQAFIALGRLLPGAERRFSRDPKLVLGAG